MADSDPLSNFLHKFQQELKDNDISSLASGFSLRDGATKADVMGELQNQVQMNAESLETFIKKLRELTLDPNHIQRVIDFKDRHFETFSSESWRESERSSKSDYTHDQSFPTPISQSQSGDEASDLSPPTSTLQKIEADSLVEDEDEEEHINVKATGDDKRFLERTVQVAKKSSDPHTKVGAILVNPKRQVIGEGYNDLPRKNLAWMPKEPWILFTHAADEAIMDALKKRHYTKDSILYTTAFPSCRDGVRIYRAGIKEVVYMKKLKSWRKIYNTAATEMLFKGEIITRKLCL